MKVLITGVAGFIGSNLAMRLLKEGYSVVGIDNLKWGRRERVPMGVDFHVIDIRDRDIDVLFRGIDVVFHLAAKNCISDCQTDPVETADINITGTVNVFNACVKTGVKKVVHAQSSALYEGVTRLPSVEWDVCPLSFYAISKFSTALLAGAYARYHKLNTTALRYFNVYGRGQDFRRTIPPIFSAIAMSLYKGESPVIYGDGNKRRDFIHIDDINDFHLLCLTNSRTDYNTFNLGCGVNYSINEVYALISEAMGIDIPPIYKEDLPGEAQNTLADISRATGIGWTPRTNLRDGIASVISYIKEEVT